MVPTIAVDHTTPLICTVGSASAVTTASVRGATGPGKAWAAGATTTVIVERDQQGDGGRERDGATAVPRGLRVGDDPTGMRIPALDYDLTG